MDIKRLFLLMVLISFFVVIKAQVTIGSNQEPNLGSLLDLKENGTFTDNVNSTQAFCLPRVYISSLNSLVDIDPSNTITRPDPDSHVGLMVYNTNDDLCAGMYSGVHVWDGTNWIPTPEYTPFPAKIGIMEDTRDPNKTEKYYYGNFGDAGTWMIENLRATLAPDGTPLTLSNATDINKNYYFPNGDLNSLTTNSEYGVLYNWAAASNNENEVTVDQQLSETLMVQGICPSGWHLPNYTEWRKLTEIIENDVCQYGTSNLATVGVNMILSNTINNNLIEGTSRSVLQGGFAVQLVGGYVNGSSSSFFGDNAAIWTSANEGLSTAYYTLFLIPNGIDFYSATRNSSYLAVRCKRD